MKIICEERTDEGLRFFKDGCCGTIRTIDGGGDKRVIEVNRLGNIYGEDKGTGYAGNVWDKESLCPTLTTMQGGNREPMIVEPTIKLINITQQVRIRKHNVDTEKLKTCLREHKKYSNKAIAEKLNKPLTLVEHWFRKDNSFSIPDADIWYQLKELLGITTDEFDLQVTEFIEQDGVFEKANRCYMTDGIAPTLTSASADEKILEPTVKIKQATQQGYAECKLGGVADLSYPTSKTRRGRVQDNGDTCPTLTATETGVCRIEKAPITTTGGQTDIGCTQMANYYRSNMSGFVTENAVYETPYRIRKLTPLECWKLMDFTEADFRRAEEVNSNAQLYKQAGNSIVKAVLMAIFKQMM